MADGKNSAPRSMDDMLKEAREKRKAEALASEIFGRRSKTPATTKSKPAPGASLASRVGVNKRPASLPRTNSAPARNSRPAQQAPQLTRSSFRDDNFRPRQGHAQQQQQQIPLAEPVIDAKGNGFASHEPLAVDGRGAGAAGVSIRGAAAGPHVVIASNFARGTTAADIESVMLDVGGQMTNCHLISSNPTVIAEMTFVEKSGAETVINTFNNKKADGRTLHVYWKSSGTGGRAPEPAPAPVEMVDDTMEVDENAQAREAEDRLREERRGRPDREPVRSYPTGPKGDRGYEDEYYRGPPRRPEPHYQDSRYGYGGGYGPRGGRYRDDGRLGYSRGGGGGRGQSWRP